MYLVDTNIWLELLLNQEKATESKEFLEKINPSDIYLTEFSLFSVGIILIKLEKHELFKEFIKDINESGINILRLYLKDMIKLIEISIRFGLDFDDAYQYILAEKYNLTLVSFDKDFDKTEKGRKTPKELIMEA